ncbi:Protein of unknown function [Pyronema omphalodes CBS 100304]|uniref:Uncharacterized protein n=1 Tax=Pyronema omphalodes (strain CBS 100304) TaxID=1076935 RepID=U4KUW5_PYROM|nr:Protein of unknown function [Pyronema omphalodes CBS 100304]
MEHTSKNGGRATHKICRGRNSSSTLLHSTSLLFTPFNCAPLCFIHSILTNIFAMTISHLTREPPLSRIRCR